MIAKVGQVHAPRLAGLERHCVEKAVGHVFAEPESVLIAVQMLDSLLTGLQHIIDTHILGHMAAGPDPNPPRLGDDRVILSTGEAG